MSGTYANLEDALKRIAELEQRNKVLQIILGHMEQRNKELHIILESDAGDVPELKRRLEKADKRIKKLEEELGGLKKERAMRNAEDEAWTEIEDLLYRREAKSKD